MTWPITYAVQRCGALYTTQRSPPSSLAQRIGLAGSPTPEEVERVVRAFHLYNVARTAPEPDPL
eukprot:5911822-Pyramimonas_sp.AAC.1